MKFTAVKIRYSSRCKKINLYCCSLDRPLAMDHWVYIVFGITSRTLVPASYGHFPEMDNMVPDSRCICHHGVGRECLRFMLA